MAWRGWRAGTGRRMRSRYIYSVAQHSLLVEAVAAHLEPGLNTGTASRSCSTTRRNM
jgi:hypothetical protein